MKKLFLALCFASFAVVVGAADFPDFTIRSGMPNFMAKIGAGQPVNVVYFGGSITEAKKGWRTFSCDFIKKLFPNAKINEINAAIGGSDSLFGLARIQRDVLVHKPDLVFCEFAVNDKNFSYTTSKHAAEGIVRMIRQVYPQCDICFVYTATDGHLQAMAAGKDPGIYAAKEEVAKYYNLPSLYIFNDALRLYTQGKLELKASPTAIHDGNGAEFGIACPVRITTAGKLAFSADGTHPYEEGHRLYSNVFRRFFEQLKIETKEKQPADYVLSQPLDPNNFAAWKTLAPDSSGITLDGNHEAVDKNLPPFRSYKDLVSALVKFAPGGGFTVEFDGAGASITYLRGPDCGWVEYTVDGDKPVRDLCFIPVSTVYHLKTVILLDEEKSGKHKITFKVLDKNIDKRKTLFPQFRPVFDKNPAIFKETNAYIGSININGNIGQ